jgi:hypothetical protein
MGQRVVNVGVEEPLDPMLCTNFGDATSSNEQDYCCKCAPMMN